MKSEDEDFSDLLSSVPRHLPEMLYRLSEVAAKVQIVYAIGKICQKPAGENILH